MSKYIVYHQINDSIKRDGFTKDLGKVGLKKINDSMSYGSYKEFINGVKIGGIRDFLRSISKNLDQNTVFLYYGNCPPNLPENIEFEQIK